MNTQQTALTAPASSASSASLLMNMDSMDRLERIADLMASGKTTVPQHLRGSKGDCFAIALQSMQWGMNPFAVAQKTHLVNGTLGYEAQLVSAVINTSGAVRDRFHFDWFGPWERVVGKFAIKKGDKGEYRVPGWQLADEEGCGVRVWATLKGEAAPRELSLLLAQARTRNSTLWADDPKQQLAYLAQKRWARLFAPDVIMGVYSPEEFEAPTEIHLGQAVVVEPAAPAQAAHYPQAEFDKNLAQWAKVVASGRKSLDDLIAMVESKAPLTAEQRQRLQEAVATLQNNTVDAAPPAVNAEQLAEQMRGAANLDALYEIGAHMDAVTDDAQRLRLGEVFDARAAELREA